MNNEQQMLKEMITIASPPNQSGMVKIGKKGNRDQLKDLMTTLGFEFMVMRDEQVDELRAMLKANDECHIDALVQYLTERVTKYTDQNNLMDAFNLFDSDNDGKLSLEEFNFFMTGFAKEYNGLFQDELVAKMIQSVREMADENEQFEIFQLVKKIQSIWQPM